MENKYLYFNPLNTSKCVVKSLINVTGS